MSETERWIVKSQKTEDGTGDIIIDLPQELLDQMGLGVGDDLELTVANGTLVLTPMDNATSVRPMFAGILRHDVYHATARVWRRFFISPSMLNCQASPSLREISLGRYKMLYV